ncbi:transmembrane protein [Candidatus Magnetobacterium bavaricum]|uniref:Transmembrane protein n=1 Tax=Candidatus Magnetobacterium bavaricum TaxID=29290 RepID=A0A0F3GHT9_9BACT|nr:transmembrane protein [Candidatus Magnetobacterium bavaricum]
MIKLGDLTLPDDLTLDNDTLTWTGLYATVNRTLDGNLVVFESYVSGRPVTLVAQQDSGWLTYAQVQALLIMAGAINTTYTLIFEDHIHNVRFRNEDSPSVDVTPILSRPNHESNDYFTGKIKLAEV